MRLSGRKPSGKRVPTYKKMQQRHKPPSPQDFASAFQQRSASRPSNTHRKLNRQGTPLRELTVGKQLNGIVQNIVRHGAFVDVGATRDGLVHVRDMSVDFVHSPLQFLRSGDEVTVWVKYVNPVSNVLGLTMIKPTLGFDNRISLSQINIGTTYQGFVERVTNYGAYIDIGAQRLGFLHVSALWGTQPRDTLEFLRLGEQIRVHVDDVDEVQSHIKLRARGRDGQILDNDTDITNLPPIHEQDSIDPQNHVDFTRVAIQRPGQSLDDDEDDEDAIYSDDLEDDDEESDFIAEDEGVLQLVEMQESPEMAEIAHMFDENTEFLGLDASQL